MTRTAYATATNAAFAILGLCVAACAPACTLVTDLGAGADAGAGPAPGSTVDAGTATPCDCNDAGAGSEAGSQVDADDENDSGPGPEAGPLVDGGGPPPTSELEPYLNPTGKSDWVLKFHDEFDGTSLDTSKWFINDSAGQTHYGPQGNAAFKPSQVSVANGNLNLRLSPTPYAKSPYTGARIDTMNKFEFKYGYYEARFKSCQQPKNWVAWWSNGHSWPADGEIDIVETLGSNTYPQAHIHTNAGGPGVGGKQIPDAASAFHVYAAHWEPNRVRIFYDGALVGTWNGSIASNHHLLLYIEGPVDGSAVSVEDNFVVDYVRLWQ